MTAGLKSERPSGERSGQIIAVTFERRCSEMDRQRPNGGLRWERAGDDAGEEARRGCDGLWERLDGAPGCHFLKR